MNRTFFTQLLFFSSLCLMLPSCTEKDEEPTIDQRQTAESPRCSEQGYLIFPTYKSLEEFLNNSTDIAQRSTSSSQINRSFPNFESLAHLGTRLLQKKNYYSQRTGSSDDLEEMSIDEYNLMKAENLILDNSLLNAMDTTLRICVEDELYKITEMGTFSSNVNKSAKLYQAIKDFNPDIIKSLEPGQTIDINPDVHFTNSFKKISTENCDLVEMTNQMIPVRGESSNEFHINYGTDSYKWKSNSLIKNILDFIRGKDISKSKQINSKLKVEVNIFDVDYKFYKSAGIKVKMQQKKKFCFIPYWVNVNAERLAIGFNEMEGELIYTNPNSMSSINPTAGAQWGRFTGTLNNITSSYIYGAYHNLTFIKDWADIIYYWMPELKIGNNNYTQNIINQIYNTPADKIYEYTKNLINKNVYTPIEHKITPTDPKMAYLIWGNTAFQYNKEHPYIMGVKEYGPMKSKSVIFDRSFGFYCYGKVPVPYTPSDFKIKSIDAFGAAFYRGRWYGVRFYQ